MILHSCDILTIEGGYDVLYSKEKIKHLFRIEAQGDALLLMVVVQGANKGLTSQIKFVNMTRRRGT